MKLTVLRIFLAVAEEGSISAAAVRLNTTQPTLSRQLMELESELGCRLFERGHRKMTLTAEGRFLRRRAQEIGELVERTLAAFAGTSRDIAGDVMVGGGETRAMHLLARAACRLRERHPHVTVHLVSGNAGDITDRLDRGLVDLGLFIGPVDLSRWDWMRLPAVDRWGVLMRRDHPLASHAVIRPGDLAGCPLVVSRQALHSRELSDWFAGRGTADPATGGDSEQRVHVAATYNLLYNASLMVEEGLGSCLCLDGIVAAGPDSPLCFRPLEPALEVGVSLAWKQHQLFSPAVRVFLEEVRAVCRMEAGAGPAGGTKDSAVPAGGAEERADTAAAAANQDDAARPESDPAASRNHKEAAARGSAASSKVQRGPGPAIS